VTEIPFVAPLENVEYGRVEQLTPLIRRVIANNPSKYSYRGTGTYIVGHGDVVVIDPGPALDEHRDALAAALRGEHVRAILVTHCHADHSPLAAWLRDSSGAPTIAYGPHGEVDPDPEPDEEPTEAAAEGDAIPAAKETIDTAFVPDIVARDGDIAATTSEFSMRAIHTPGHTSNHLCFSLDAENALFSGDHVMGWSTTVVSPPDGDMASYIDSLRRVAGRDDSTIWPTHGNPITDPQPFLQAYLQHRLDREEQVLAEVRAGIEAIPDIVVILYADVRPELHKAAGRSVLSHLAKLVRDGRVVTVDGLPPTRTSLFRAV
jgi:glyoxylase-like metal-dependent hydrolase (beta-lactamase superfamily II)